MSTAKRKRDRQPAMWMTTTEEQRRSIDTAALKGTICPWVFHRSGARIKTFRRVWLPACRAAGCPGRILHDVRRTAVRNLVRAGVSGRGTMQMTGHKTRSVFDRDNIVSPGDLVEARKRIDFVRPAETLASRQKA